MAKLYITRERPQSEVQVTHVFARNEECGEVCGDKI